MGDLQVALHVDWHTMARKKAKEYRKHIEGMSPEGFLPRTSGIAYFRSSIPAEVF
jgi:hypothetical protein